MLREFCLPYFCFVFSEEVHARYKDILQAEYDRIIDQCMEEVNSIQVCSSAHYNSCERLLKTNKLVD